MYDAIDPSGRTTLIFRSNTSSVVSTPANSVSAPHEPEILSLLAGAPVAPPVTNTIDADAQGHGRRHVRHCHAHFPFALSHSVALTFIRTLSHIRSSLSLSHSFVPYLTFIRSLSLTLSHSFALSVALTFVCSLCHSHIRSYPISDSFALCRTTMFTTPATHTFIRSYPVAIDHRIIPFYISVCVHICF